MDLIISGVCDTKVIWQKQTRVASNLGNRVVMHNYDDFGCSPYGVLVELFA